MTIQSMGSTEVRGQATAKIELDKSYREKTDENVLNLNLVSIQGSNKLLSIRFI